MKINGKTTTETSGQVEIVLELEIGVSTEHAFDAFTDGIGNWWQAGDFQVGGDGSIGMVLEACPEGLWFEDWGDGDGHIWAKVVSLKRGQLIRMEIPKGAMWSDPGTVEVSFAPTPSGCTVKLTHCCTQSAESYNHEAYIPHWEAQVGVRYKQFAETGSVENSVGVSAI